MTDWYRNLTPQQRAAEMGTWPESMRVAYRARIKKAMAACDGSLLAAIRTATFEKAAFESVMAAEIERRTAKTAAMHAEAGKGRKWGGE